MRTSALASRRQGPASLALGSAQSRHAIRPNGALCETCMVIGLHLDLVRWRPFTFSCIFFHHSTGRPSALHDQNRELCSVDDSTVFHNHDMCPSSRSRVGLLYPVFRRTVHGRLTSCCKIAHTAQAMDDSINARRSVRLH